MRDRDARLKALKTFGDQKSFDESLQEVCTASEQCMIRGIAFQQGDNSRRDVLNSDLIDPIDCILPTFGRRFDIVNAATVRSIPILAPNRPPRLRQPLPNVHGR